MIISTLPTASEIRIESRLNPAQVNRDFPDVAALDADIAARIPKKKAIAENKLVRVLDTARNQIVATEALKLLVLASLYGSAGQLNSAYWEQANRYRIEANELFADLLSASSDSEDADTSGASTLSLAPYRIDENDFLVVN